MNKTARSPRPSLILMVAPTLLVVIGFYSFYYQPTARLLQARRGENARLLLEQPRIQVQNNTLHAQISELNRQQIDQQATHAELQTRQLQALAIQAGFAHRLKNSVASAETMNQVMAMLGEQRLAIVANEAQPTLDSFLGEDNQQLLNELNLAERIREPLRRALPRHGEQEASAKRQFSESFVSSMTEPQSDDFVGLSPKRQYWISIQGPFADVRHATQALAERFPEVTVTGVELQTIDVRSELRNWKFSICF